MRSSRFCVQWPWARTLSRWVRTCARRSAPGTRAHASIRRTSAGCWPWASPRSRGEESRASASSRAAMRSSRRIEHPHPARFAISTATHSRRWCAAQDMSQRFWASFRTCTIDWREKCSSRAARARYAHPFAGSSVSTRDMTARRHRGAGLARGARARRLVAAGKAHHSGRG